MSATGLPGEPEGLMGGRPPFRMLNPVRDWLSFNPAHDWLNPTTRDLLSPTFVARHSSLATRIFV